MAFPRGCLVDDGWKIKQKVRIPVSIVGRINHPDLAEEILAAGKADFISLGRALHADPYWPMKAQEGRVDDIRICPACMSCSDQLATNIPITCSINPEAGRESELKIKPAPKAEEGFGGRRRSRRHGSGAGCLPPRSQGRSVREERQMGGQLNYAAKPLIRRNFWGSLVIWKPS